jgi:hypothetical protein
MSLLSMTKINLQLCSIKDASPPAPFSTSTPLYSPTFLRQDNQNMKKSDKSDGGGRRRQQASSSSAAAALQQHGFAAGALTFASFSGGSTQSPGSPSPSDSESGVSAALDPNVALFLKQVCTMKAQTYKRVTCSYLSHFVLRQANATARLVARPLALCCSNFRQSLTAVVIAL